MHADYKCECGEVEDISYSIKDGPPKTIPCPKCNKEMKRVWKVAIHIPEGFGEDLTTTISNRMAKSRPTGRDKVLY